MTSCMCFMQTFVMICTFSEILSAQIDHTGPNWTFLTLKVTQHYSYSSFEHRLRITPQGNTRCNKIVQHFSTTEYTEKLCENLTILILTMTLRAIQISPQTIQTLKKYNLNGFNQIHLFAVHVKIEKSLHKVTNQPILPFRPLKIPLWRFNQIHILQYIDRYSTLAPNKQLSNSLW